MEEVQMVMTKETESIINDGLEKLLGEIEESIIIGACEEVGPNSSEYDDFLDGSWEKSIDMLVVKINHYSN